LERQNRTAAEDAKSSDLVAWTLELEGEKFACLNSVESLAARTPEVTSVGSGPEDKKSNQSLSVLAT